MFVVTNTIKVKQGTGAQLAERFSEGEGVSEMPGFVRMEVWHGVNKDQEEIKVSTLWDNEEAFRGWTQSESFRKAHQGRGKNEDILGASLDQYELLAHISAED